MGKRNHIKLGLIVIFLSVIVSCSPRLSKSVLTFFFDGVPVSDTLVLSDSINNEIDDLSTEEFRVSPFAVNVEMIVHYPYMEKECLSCHDEDSKSEIVMKQPDLCYMCHDDYSNIYSTVHGPVSGGYCTSCHNPHMSKEKKLLIRTGQQMCLYCHDSKDVFKNEIHEDIADTECTLCHNPHGGDDRFLLN
jgi:predicted CXXCH cytochrome family protein